MMLDMIPELSELCGIHAGDGYLRGPDKRAELDISGNIEEDGYYNKHVKELFKAVFNMDVQCRLFSSRNTYGFVIRDKNIIHLMHEIGFPYGNKSTIIRVPDSIIKSGDKEIVTKFLRGLFDTDGCIHFWKRNKGNYNKFKKTHHYYPIIAFSTVSKSLFEDIKVMLVNIGFQKIGSYINKSQKISENNRYVVRIYGPENIEKFFRLIGSKNPVKLSRFLVWKKLGHCPAHTTLKQREEMLKSSNN